MFAIQRGLESRKLGAQPSSSSGGAPGSSSSKRSSTTAAASGVPGRTGKSGSSQMRPSSAGANASSPRHHKASGSSNWHNTLGSISGSVPKEHRMREPVASISEWRDHAQHAPAPASSLAPRSAAYQPGMPWDETAGAQRYGSGAAGREPFAGSEAWAAHEPSPEFGEVETMGANEGRPRTAGGGMGRAASPLPINGSSSAASRDPSPSRSYNPSSGASRLMARVRARASTADPIDSQAWASNGQGLPRISADVARTAEMLSVGLDQEALRHHHAAPVKPPSRTASIFRLGRKLRRKSESQEASAQAHAASLRADSSNGSGAGRLSVSPLGMSVLPKDSHESSRSGDSHEPQPGLSSSFGTEPRVSMASSRPYSSSQSDIDGRASSDLDAALRYGVLPNGARRDSSSSLRPLTSVDGEVLELVTEPHAGKRGGAKASVPSHPQSLPQLRPSLGTRTASTPMTSDAPSGHQPTASIDSMSASSSFSHRRRSLAFLGSAISTGASPPLSLAPTSAGGEASILAGGPVPVFPPAALSPSPWSDQLAQLAAQEQLLHVNPTLTESPLASPRINGMPAKRSPPPPQLPPPVAALPAPPHSGASSKMTPLTAQRSASGPSTSRVASLFRTKASTPRDEAGPAPTSGLPSDANLVGLGTFMALDQVAQPEQLQSGSSSGAGEQAKQPRKTRSQNNLRLLRKPSVMVPSSKAGPSSPTIEALVRPVAPESTQRMRRFRRPRTSAGEVTVAPAPSAKPKPAGTMVSGPISFSMGLGYVPPPPSLGGGSYSTGMVQSPPVSRRPSIAPGSPGSMTPNNTTPNATPAPAQPATFPPGAAAQPNSAPTLGRSAPWDSQSSRLELLDSSPEEERRGFNFPQQQPGSGLARRGSSKRESREWGNAGTSPVEPFGRGPAPGSAGLFGARHFSEQRPSSSRGAGEGAPSRLDSSGGAAGLFGGGGASSGQGTPRQRASSLIPSLPWSRSRTSSSAGIEGLPSPSVSQAHGEALFSSAVASITAHDIVLQEAMRRTSLAIDGNREHVRTVPPPRAAQSARASTEVSPTDSVAARAQAKLPAPLAKAPAPAFATPEEFIKHVLSTTPHTDVAAVLASSADPLHRAALSTYLRRFLFTSNPLDIALRKLLMSLCLPKETQQIDRVMEAFARRYNECNEGLFLLEDQPYILAFSLMMLHTDAFNRNAKNKMSKADYVRNTSSSRVPVEILEYLYDNLTFTQFIYVEDEGEIQRRTSEPSTEKAASGSGFFAALTPNNASSARTRIDPYYLIAQGRTSEFRADIFHIIPEDSPFSAKGTATDYDVEALNRAFAAAPSIEIVAMRRPSLPTGVSSWGGDAPYPSTAMMTTIMLDTEPENVVTLRVTKVGCVSRKDDIGEGGKKAQSRKWRTCGMVLTNAQLLFFTDLAWVSALDKEIASQTEDGTLADVLITPRINFFRPDSVLSLGDAIAVRDTSYSKYENVFRLVTTSGPHTRQYLIQTPNEADMNDWIAKINFCAAFRCGGVRVRGLDPPPPDSDSTSTAPQSPATIGSRVEAALGQSRRVSETPSYAELPAPALSFGDSGGGSQNATPVSTPSAASSVPSSPVSPFPSQSAAPSLGSLTPLIGIMRRRLNARRKELTPAIAAATTKLKEFQQLLADDMRLAKHLSILTPFQKATRDRIEAAALPLSIRIRQHRLEVARWQSRRDILMLELAAGERAARAVAPPTSFAEPAGHWPSSSSVDMSRSANLSDRVEEEVDTSHDSETQQEFAFRTKDSLGGAESRPGTAKPRDYTGSALNAAKASTARSRQTRPSSSASTSGGSHLRHVTEGGSESARAEDLLAPIVTDAERPTTADSRDSTNAELTYPTSAPLSATSSVNSGMASDGAPSLEAPRSSASDTEQPEEWRKTKAAHPKRVSLATLPGADALQRFSLGRASGAAALDAPSESP